MPDDKLTHIDLFSGIPSGVSPLPQNGPDSGQYTSLRSIRSAKLSSESIGPAFQSTTTLKHSNGPEKDQLFYQPVLPANRFPLLDEREERRMIAISGRNCYASFPKSGPIGLLQKMLLESPIWFFGNGRMIWKTQATRFSPLIFRLAVVDYLRWNGISGLLPRAEASSWKGAAKNAWRGSKNYSHSSGGRIIRMLRDSPESPIYVDPGFIEAVKGFPASWTVIEHSAMPFRPRSHIKPSKQSQKL